jgi:protein-disulfide isomerase
MDNRARPPQLTVPVTEGRDHIQGPASAPVTIVEYGDFECPFCRQAHQMLQQLHNRAGDRFRLIFRHFPISQLHPHAQRAAEAAEAAAGQGQFWSMHDTLYEHQERLDEDSLYRYAKTLGLDMPRFRSQMQEGGLRGRVREDFSSGLRSGVNGTPTFFINGLRHDGGKDLQTFLGLIEEQLHRGSPPG